jgi:mono/diheme cytochrome c family protein
MFIIINKTFIMKKALRLSDVILAFALVMMISCGPGKKPVVQEPAAPTHEQIVQRGQYLVTTMGCNDCHSPKRMGQKGPEIIPELLLSGYPGDRPLMKVSKEALKNGWVLMTGDLTEAVGPWGASFAANLTPDQTGILNWTEEAFVVALKQGWFKGMEGTRMLLPPMPWENFATMKDEDIKAIYTYLLSIKPVSNSVPDALSPDELK